MGHWGDKFKMRLFSLLLLLLLLPPLRAAAQDFSLNENLLYRLNFGSAEDVRLLLAQGADPNARTPQGESALDVAIARDDPESTGMAETLLDKGADPDTVDRYGNAPLINAIKYRQDDIVKALLLKGADYHITLPDGTSLLDYTKKVGDKESIEAVQKLIDKEEAYFATLRTPERFKEMIALYTTDSCLYQYWSYFLASKQAPERDDATRKKIAGMRNTLHQLAVQIQKYYPTASLEGLHKAATEAVNQIYTLLNSMISNSNRAESGIGADDDGKMRCQRIIGGLDLEHYVPFPVASNRRSANAPR